MLNSIFHSVAILSLGLGLAFFLAIAADYLAKFIVSFNRKYKNKKRGGE